MSFNIRVIFLLLLLGFVNQVSAQLSEVHYIPPLYYTLGEDGLLQPNKCKTSYINEQELSLATDSTIPISVNITDGGGTPLFGSPITISRGNPRTITIGEDGTTPIMVDKSSVNEVVSGKGLILMSDKPFYASIRIATNSDKCLGLTTDNLFDGEFIVSKGDKALGTSFRLVNTILAPSSLKSNPSHSHYVGLMATEDNTTIRLSDYDSNLKFGVYDPIKKDFVKYSTDIEKTMKLNKGESVVFIALGSRDNPRGFTGALLSSNKPIVVNVGNMYGQDFDLMVDQIVPINRLGKKYGLIIGNGDRDRYEQGIIVTTEPNTSVSMDGGRSITSLPNAGNSYIVNYQKGTSVHRNVYIETSKPVYVYQILAGGKGKANAIVDGGYQNVTTSLNFIPPLSEYYYNYIDMIPRANKIANTTFEESFVTILTKKDNDVTLNGSLLLSNKLELKGSDDWVTMRIPIQRSNTTGNINIESHGPMAVGVFGGKESLGFAGYFSGFNLLETKICESESPIDIFTYMEVKNPSPTGNGTWTPAFSSGTNVFDPNVDNSDNYKFSYTSASGKTRVSSIKITKIPVLDITGMNLSNLANRECISNDIPYNVGAPNLSDGNYKLTYDLEKSGIATITKTETVRVLSGVIKSTLQASDITSVGTYTLKITKISNDACQSLITGVQRDIEITPDVDEKGITLKGAVCKLDNTDYRITVQMPNGQIGDEYRLSYKVTGDNTKAETFEDIILDTNRQASWNIPYANISNIGANEIELLSIQFKNTLCATKALRDVKLSFETFYTSATMVTLPPSRKICQGSDLTIEISDVNLPDDTYRISYQITQSNTVTNTIDVVITSGRGTLTIPASDVSNLGDNTLEIQSVKKKTSVCTLPLSITENFTVSPVLLKNDLTFTTDACVVIDSNVRNIINIKNNNPLTASDEYTVVYQIIGTNQQSEKTVNVTMTNTTGQIIIPLGTFSTAGDNTLFIKSIKHKGKICDTTLDLQYPIKTVHQASLTTNVNATIGAICTLTNQTINIGLSNYITGISYELTYSLSGSNTSTNKQITIVPDNVGAASFIIPGSLFPNEGNTSITIVPTTTCNNRVINPRNISVNITMNLTPTISETDVLLPNFICFGSNVNVSIMNAATIKDGLNYTVEYKLSGANSTVVYTHNQVAVNNKLDFVINAADLRQGGITSLDIESISSNSGCAYKQKISKSFTVVQIDLTKNDIVIIETNQCNGSSLININNSVTPITDGQYRLNYSINNIAKIIDVTISQSVMLTSINRENFREGNNNLKLDKLTHIASGCTANFINEEINIDKQGLLDFDRIQITVPSLFCKNDKGLEVEINTPTLSTNTTEFIVKYDLLGANRHQDIEQEVIINTNKVTFEVPIEYFNNRGATTIIVKVIRAKSKSCQGNNMNVSKDFYTSITRPISREEVQEKYFFCKEDTPTLLDIYLNNSQESNIYWYESIEAKDPISKLETLTETRTLYARRMNKEKCLGNFVTSKIDFSVCDNITIPSKVSPNGDNINDKFVIKDLDLIYPNFTLSIYDRNGVLVFYDDNLTDSFQGEPNQSIEILSQSGKLPKGVYYYILNYNSSVNNRKKPVQGFFYLTY